MWYAMPLSMVVLDYLIKILVDRFCLIVKFWHIHILKDFKKNVYVITIFDFEIEHKTHTNNQIMLMNVYNVQETHFDEQNEKKPTTK